jgi:hypothetical protein
MDEKAKKKLFELRRTESGPVAKIPSSHVSHLEEVLREYAKNPSPLISHEEMKEHLKQLKRRLGAKRTGKTA